MHILYIYTFSCTSVAACACWVFQLTSDYGCDLVPAGPNAVLDLTDKSGVDSIVHLQYLQFVLCYLHCVWHLS